MLSPTVRLPATDTRVLVTGHDGYIGRSLVPQLLAAGFHVTGLDSHLYRGCTLFDARDSIPAIEKDIRDVTVLDLQGFDAVVHLAGLSNDPLGNLDPGLTFDINRRGTLQVARCAREAGVTRFVQASTCSIYGASDDGWLTEASPFNPVTPYGLAKAQVEPELLNLADDTFSPTLLRFGTAYGVSSRLRGDLVVNNLVGYAVATSQILLKSDGTAWRPLVHIEDISRAIVATVRADTRDVTCQAINVGSTSENYRICEVADLISRALPAAEVAFADNACPDRRNYRVNCDRLSELLPDGCPEWTLEAGVDQLINTFTKVGLTRPMLEGSTLQRVRRIRDLLAGGQLSSDLRWNCDFRRRAA